MRIRNTVRLLTGENVIFYTQKFQKKDRARIMCGIPVGWRAEASDPGQADAVSAAAAVAGVAAALGPAAVALLAGSSADLGCTRTVLDFRYTGPLLENGEMV
jgi:hypothetical protein